MIQHKQNTVAYAVGFLEDYIENTTEPIEIAEEDAGDTTYTAHVADTNDHREQVRAMMKVVSEGLTQLSRENASLLSKILLAKTALS